MLDMILSSWTSTKTAKDKPSKIAGNGFFAIAPINKGEVVAVKMGHVIDKLTLELNRHIVRDSEIEIADDLYLAPLTPEEFPESMVHFNHSCEPNCGIGGNVLLVATRDIAEGEELTTDYAMHFTDPVYSMSCNCRTPCCRLTISGNDWKLPDLQRKYSGFFSWYIEQKIKEAT